MRQFRLAELICVICIYIVGAFVLLALGLAFWLLVKVVGTLVIGVIVGWYLRGLIE